MGRQQRVYYTVLSHLAAKGGMHQGHRVKKQFEPPRYQGRQGKRGERQGHIGKTARSEAANQKRVNLFSLYVLRVLCGEMSFSI
jgi:hypothetical protein